MSSNTLERLAPWLAALVFVAVWWCVVAAFGIKSFVLPTPWETVVALCNYRYALFVNGLATLATT